MYTLRKKIMMDIWATCNKNLAKDVEIMLSFSQLTLPFDLEFGSHTRHKNVLFLCWALVPNDMIIGRRMQAMACSVNEFLVSHLHVTWTY